MQVEWSAHALRHVQRVERADRREAERIVAAIARLAASGQGDVKRLTGEGSLLRLRVGDYRVIYTADAVTDTLTVLAVRRRDQAYR